jgi:hypothetical protein
MKISVEWTFGNFDVEVTVEAEVEGKKAEGLLKAATLNVLQRKPASELEKKLAGYEKRPAGFERSSIGYSDENAGVIQDFFPGDYELFQVVRCRAMEHTSEKEGSKVLAERFVATLLGADGGKEKLVQTLNLLAGMTGGEEVGMDSSRATLVLAAHAAGLGQRK